MSKTTSSKNICALCKKNEANKKNTHYLTDSIIRSCLNEEGSNKREKGAYYNVSADNYFTDFNFQRATSIKTLEKALGRLPTDEEIEKAKLIPYSVDFVFCSDCENKFTDIENKFIKDILPEFRQDNDEIEAYTEIEFENSDIQTIRLFFLMQLWRSSICVDGFSLSPSVSEELRNIILENFNAKTPELKKYSLSVGYLNTTGGAKEYTRNCVGYKFDIATKVVFMNDFIIQFSENVNRIEYSPLYSLNDKKTYKDYHNHEEDIFLIQVFTNEERMEFLKTYNKDVRVPNVKKFFIEKFCIGWKGLTGKNPSKKVQQEYIAGLFNFKGIPPVQRLSADRIVSYTTEFYVKKKIIKIRD